MLECQLVHVGKYLVYRLYKEERLALKKMRPHRKRKAVKHREERLRLSSERWHNPAGKADYEEILVVG